MIFSFLRFASLLSHTDNPDADVHFHQGPQGHPAACHNPACIAPRLTV